ncbi:MAG: diguanylate cyclase [Thermoleophilia bacterium]|nr:diguanylate cyclase [Thermoleophilia bacterium]
MPVFLALLALVSAFISVFMGSFVLTRSPRERLNQVFFALSIIVACWAFVEFQFRMADSFDEAMLWLHFAFFWPLPAAILIHFVLIFTGHTRFLGRPWNYLLIYGPAAIITGLFFLSDSYASYPVERRWGWTFALPDTGFSDISYLYFPMMAFISVVLCFRFYYLQTEPLIRKQAKFALATVSFYAGVVTLEYGLLPLIHFWIPELTALTFAVAVSGFFGYSIWKYQMFTLTPELAADKIIATMSDALLLIDTRGIVINTNDAARQLLGFGAEELEGMQADKIFPEGWLRESIIEKQGIYGNIESVTDIESVIRSHAGENIAVSLSSSNFRDHDEALLGTICIARNISDRKRTEELIRHQSEGLVARNAELTALYEISNALRSSLDRDKMLKRSLETITSLAVFDMEHKGGIFVVEGTSLKLIASQGDSPEFIEAHRNMTVDDCLCGLAARTGKMIFSASSVEDDRHTLSYPDMPDHGHVIVPLKAMDAVTGVMYLYLPPGSRFDERQKKLMETIGSQLAIAMENVRLYEETRALALHDPLTGLANRRLMSLELEKALARASRTSKPFSLVMLDLDHFKDYNDLYGHAAGDRLLAGVSALILEEIRRIDLGVRYGGEEFLLILPDTELADAKDVAERIRIKTDAASFPVSDGMQSSGITVSLGVASWDETITSADILVARADTALYMAKSRGRNRVQGWMAQGRTSAD